MPSEKILEQKKQQVAELSAALKESCTEPSCWLYSRIPPY